MNNVNVVGGLIRDAELKYLNTGTPLMTFSIAVSEYVGSGKEDWSNYFYCSMFGKRAESLMPYMVKGQKVAIEGKLHQDRWETEGKARRKVIIKVNNVDLVGTKKGTAPTKAENKPVNNNAFEDDIPF